MLKKWKKTIKLFGTTIIVLIYVTLGLFNSEILKGDEKSKKVLAVVYEPPTGTTEKYPPRTLRTVIGFSDEFRLRKELDDRIECDAAIYPDEGTDSRGSMWIDEETLGIRIFSAYYDQRQEPYHYVRIMGLVRRNSSFYCQIWYQNNETITYATQKAIIREVWSAKWGPKNKTCKSEYPAVISCLAPRTDRQIPSWVSFVDKSCSGSGKFVRIAPPASGSQKKNFVVCVKPMNLHQLRGQDVLEWLEINFGLGAEAVVFYGFNSTEAMFANHTKKENLVWKAFRPPQHSSCALESFEQSIWHKRKMEIIAYNDCFYSNLYLAKFVVPLDLDEIIVPKSGNNWFEAFRSHFLNAKLSAETKNVWPEDIDNYASFSVRNAYFFPDYPKDAIIRGLKLPKRDQKVPKKLVKAPPEGESRPLEDSIFDRTLRSYRLSPETDSVKSFIHVAKTVSVFNHYAFHVLGDTTRQFVFPENVFLLNHYRNSCDPVLIDGCREFLNQVIYDNSLEKFRGRGKHFLKIPKQNLTQPTAISAFSRLLSL